MQQVIYLLSHILSSWGFFVGLIVIYLFEKGSHYVAKPGLELIILLPQTPTARIIRVHHRAYLDTVLQNYKSTVGHSEERHS